MDDTNVIEPANIVIRSAARFCASSARSRSCFSTAGLSGLGGFLGTSKLRSRRPSAPPPPLEPPRGVDEVSVTMLPFVGPGPIRPPGSPARNLR